MKIKNLSSIVLIGYLILLHTSCNATCTASSTGTNVTPPQVLLDALGICKQQCELPLKIKGQGVSITCSVTPNINIIESDCLDSKNCKCGTSDTGTGTCTNNISASASFDFGKLGPVAKTIAGYYVSFQCSAKGDLSGNATVSGNLTVSRSCGADWTYSVSGKGTATITDSGSASASVSVGNDQSDPNPSVYSISGSNTGSFVFNCAFAASNTGSPSGAVTYASDSQTITASVTDIGSISLSYSFGGGGGITFN
jgi:hypothetical protein